MVEYVFDWNGETYLSSVPDTWPLDAVAEVVALRIGLRPGDVFSLIRNEGKNRYDLIATGTSV
jgi:hypothetical protein